MFFDRITWIGYSYIVLGALHRFGRDAFVGQALQPVLLKLDGRGEIVHVQPIPSDPLLQLVSRSPSGALSETPPPRLDLFRLSRRSRGFEPILDGLRYALGKDQPDIVRRRRGDGPVPFDGRGILFIPIPDGVGHVHRLVDGHQRTILEDETRVHRDYLGRRGVPCSDDGHGTFDELSIGDVCCVGVAHELGEIVGVVQRLELSDERLPDRRGCFFLQSGRGR